MTAVRISHIFRGLLSISMLVATICYSEVAQAGSAGGVAAAADNSSSPVEDYSADADSVDNYSNGAVNYQSDVYNSYDGSFSGYQDSSSNLLSYPNCQGVCTFAVGRMRPSYDGNPNWEAVTGVVAQFGSPAKRKAKAEQKYAEARAALHEAEAKERLIKAERASDAHIKNLTDALADALKNDEKEKSKMLAMLVHEKLGYGSYQELLDELSRD